MGNRQNRKAKRAEASTLERAADRAILAYESLARSEGANVTNLVVIGATEDGRANISLSCQDGTDIDTVVLEAARAYFADKGKTVGIFDAHPRR